MAEVDIDDKCEEFREQCDALARVVQDGLSADRLKQMGIKPRSKQAKQLEDDIISIFLRCCARLSGPDTPPPEPEPEPEPGPNDDPEEIALAMIGNPALVIGGGAWVIGRAIDWAAVRAFLLRAVNPLLWVAVVAAFIALLSSTQVCPWKSTRLRPNGSKECVYRCPDGTWYYTYEFFGGDCLPSITKPI